ncbi:MAG: antitoxin VbhA family protein [Ruminococcus sp.]|nr:antitoxin VbhA family protein [Ruminococcus sp.]
MLDKDKEKRLRAVKIAKAINSIEGVPIPDETNDIYRQWIDGKITDEQLTSAMLSLCTKI